MTSAPAFGPASHALGLQGMEVPQTNHRSRWDSNPGPKNGKPAPYPLCQSTAANAPRAAFPLLILSDHLVDVELEPLDGLRGGLRDLFDAARADGAHDVHRARGLRGSRRG